MDILAEEGLIKIIILNVGRDHLAVQAFGKEIRKGSCLSSNIRGDFTNQQPRTNSEGSFAWVFLNEAATPSNSEHASRMIADRLRFWLPTCIFNVAAWMGLARLHVTG